MTTPSLQLHLSSVPMRFGRSANQQEVKQIQQTVRAQWPAATIDSQLCFAEAESTIPVWNGIKQFFTQLLDNLKQRWIFYRKGFGLFPKVIPTLTDVYRLKQYPSAERANTEFARLKKISQDLQEIKTEMLKKARAERAFRERTQTKLGNINPRDFGLSSKWLNPFSILQPFKISWGQAQ